MSPARLAPTLLAAIACSVLVVPHAPTGDVGELDTAGTIEVGKRSDLVLLDKDPFADITHTRSVAGVLMRGRWLSGAELAP